MKKLYEKNELTFALVWIAIYVVGTSLAEALSESISVYKLVSAVFHIALTAALFLWVRRNGLMEKYGLFLPRYRLLQAWFFIPLALVCLYKLVFSPALRFSATESILFVISMLCVGFLEELIFRGFLFRAIEKENLTRAIIISSVTFGIGHIVNLLNGQNLSGMDRKTIARHVAYVPQNHSVAFPYTVREAVLMGRSAYLSPFGSMSLS